ncbi:MAG: hypothetical protein OEU36_04250 [Gammaproteobacteria bacterium]|nr:hypothetical protein [Gammaproteobacteria bacterium]
MNKQTEINNKRTERWNKQVDLIRAGLLENAKNHDSPALDLADVHNDERMDLWPRIVGHLDEVISEDRITQTRLRGLRRSVLTGHTTQRRIPVLPTAWMGLVSIFAVAVLLSVFLFSTTENATRLEISPRAHSNTAPVLDVGIDFDNIDFYDWLYNYGQELEQYPTDT